MVDDKYVARIDDLWSAWTVMSVVHEDERSVNAANHNDNRLSKNIASCKRA